MSVMRIDPASKQFLIGFFLLAAVLLAQAPPTSGPPRGGVRNAEEKEMPGDVPRFTTNVDLVMVPVVVRDGKGNAIGDLTKHDFELFDKGIGQIISKFSIEKVRSDAPVDSRSPDAGKSIATTATSEAVPARFVVYYFDDVHTGFADLTQIRGAAAGHMKTALGRGDRAAVYTASGLVEQDFTDDRDKLIAALDRLRTRLNIDDPHPCPPMSPYEAHLIQNAGDQEVLAMATADTIG